MEKLLKVLMEFGQREDYSRFVMREAHITALDQGTQGGSGRNPEPSRQETREKMMRRESLVKKKASPLGPR
jgi:hypothetical protein